MRPDASVVGSVHTLLPFFLLGVVLGVCFDVFRVLRLWRHGGKNRVGGKFTSLLLRAKMRRAILKEEATGAVFKKLLCVCDEGLIIAEDVLFCLAAAAFYLLLQYDINSGVFRWYLLALCALGFWLYLVTLGRGTMRVALFLTALVRFVPLFFYNHTVYYCMLGFAYAFCKIGSAVRAVFRQACADVREKKVKMRARAAMDAAEALASSGFLYDGSRRKRQGVRRMFTKQKREKPQQTIVTLKKKPEPSRRGKGNLFVKIAVIVFGVFVAVSVFNMQSEVASLKEEEATLTQQIAQYQNRIEELQADMLTPFDDTYRIRVAREKLGYCFTDETVYYNDISN